MRGVWCLSLLFGISVFSGCFGGEDLDPFGEWDVPTWEPGYEWTWKVSAVETQGAVTMYTPRVQHKVLRLDAMEGVPIYWVETVGRAEEPFDLGPTTGGGYQAVRQADLLPVGETHWFGYGSDGCTAEAFLVDPAPPVPLFSFPLTRGATWSDEDALERPLSATALGAEVVKTTAGEFQSVKIRMEIEGDEYGSAGTIDAWYAHEVKNLVRLEVRHDGGRLTLELEDFKLDEGAPQEAPFHHVIPDERTVPGPLPEKQYQIVSDVAFPLNAATHDTTVRLGVQAAPLGSDAPVVVDEVPEMDDLAPGQVMLWQLRDWDRTVIASGEGVTWTVELPPAGAFDVTARKSYPIYDTAADSCHDWSTRNESPPFEKRLARTMFSVDWAETFTVEHPAGPEATYPVGTIEVGPRARVLADFVVEQTGTHPDDGYLQVTFPDGTVEAWGANETIARDVSRTENWTVAWIAEGADPFTIPGATFGHRVTGTLAVRY